MAAARCRSRVSLLAGDLSDGRTCRRTISLLLVLPPRSAAQPTDRNRHVVAGSDRSRLSPMSAPRGAVEATCPWAATTSLGPHALLVASVCVFIFSDVGKQAVGECAWQAANSLRLQLSLAANKRTISCMVKLLRSTRQSTCVNCRQKAEDTRS